MRRAWRGLAAAFVLCAAAASPLAAPLEVQVPSLDARRGDAVQLPALWFAAPAAAAAPALVLLHGCGGLYDGRGRLAERYTELAAWLNARGVSALVLDSFTPRGERSICTQKIGTRQVTQRERRRDALGALRWLAAQPGVDRARIGLLGWSNGGSTVLAGTNLRHAEVAAARAARPSLAVAFYPGCEAELERGYEPSAALLMLLGAADDWTPAAPCEALAGAADTAQAPAPQFELYAGAYHGFDGQAPLRLRSDVPNGVHPGQGVHVGGDAAARAASRLRLERFLRERWALVP
ncbi:MAG: dienelactone hydrolase family protein [Rubrivivax sp.]